MTSEQAAQVQAYAAIAGVLVTALGLVAILVQIRSSSKVAQRQNASMFLLGDHRKLLLDEAEAALGGLIHLFGKEQVSEETAAKILDNPVMDAKLSALLNFYETIAAGIRCGAFDEEMFRFAYMKPVRVLYWQLAPYIHMIRKQAKNDRIFSELRFIAARWDRWSDAAPHFFLDGEVILDVPYDELPMPTEAERRNPKLRRH